MLRAFIIAGATPMEFAAKRCNLEFMNPGSASLVVPNPGNAKETAVLFGDSEASLKGRSFSDAAALANGVVLTWNHTGFGGVSGILTPHHD